MAKKMDSAQLKIAEKLVVLNDRSQGMLTRVYNVKKTCASAELKPRFLKEESIRSEVARVIKKFPATKIKEGLSGYSNINQAKGEILKSLSLYYHTFAELLDLKDHILQLLTTMDANQCQLDITINYDLTAGFLNLISNFVALMILLGRIDDRKAILSLYNAAYGLINDRCEQSFPRLRQMVIDYENPLRKLSEDFSPINRLVQAALTSLRDIYFRRNISASQLRNAGMISLVSNPQQMLYAAQTETVACEYLSLETMDRWIIFGITVCHSSLLADPLLEQMLHKSLENSLSLRLFRDEPLLVYPMLIGFFSETKAYSKRVTELKQMNADAMKSCAVFHAHRRQFIRNALREICQLVKDQPGLLGPKILFVWMGLSLARDEVLWLLRHIDLANVNKKLRAALENVTTDRYLPELLFYMCELRELVHRHARVIASYYREFIAGYDAIALREMIEEDGTLLNGLADNELTLIRAFIDAITHIKTHDVKLNGLRLDWYRFQANVSVLRSPFQLKERRLFATTINTTIFHTKMIDKLGEMLRETSDLSIYCYYPAQFEAHVEAALKFAPQARYAVAFAHVAEHFAHSTHDMCPEEKNHIVERGFVCCTAVLEKISAYASRAFDDFLREEHQLANDTTPRSCAEMMYINNLEQQQLQQNSSKRQQQQQQQSAREPRPFPGYESLRAGAKPPLLSELERRNHYLVEILQGIAHGSQIHVSDCVFMPKAFLHERLEFHVMKCLVQYAKPDKSTAPRPPSDVYTYLQSLMATVQRVDDCVGIDLARLISESLLQQSQQIDSGGHYTLTSIYCDFYCELLHRASLGQLMYSDHLKAFILNYDNALHAQQQQSPMVDFAPEQFTDPRELRALAQLIGPYGVKIIGERLISMVAGQIIELFKIVRQPATHALLREARKSYDRPARMREIVAALGDPALSFQQQQNGANGSSTGTISGGGGKKGQNTSNASPQSGSSGSNSPVDSILQRVTIIGGIVAFRDLLYDAVNEVLKQRMPFLMRSLEDLYESSPDHIKMALSEVCAAAGKRTEVDQGLVNILRMKWGLPPEKPPLTREVEEHYDLCCLIIVFIAIALPQLAASRLSFFKASYVATPNNSHTISLAVNLIAGALFYIHGREDVGDRMREFLALSSSGLVQLVNSSAEGASDSLPNHPSLYILLEGIVRHSPWLNYTLLESCLPFPLIRSAYLQCYRAEAVHGALGASAGSAR